MAEEFYELHRPKKVKLSDVREELRKHFFLLQDKEVICDCSDSEESSWFSYLLENFNELKLKKLVAIYTNRSRPTSFYLPKFHEDSYFRYKFRFEITCDSFEESMRDE